MAQASNEVLSEPGEAVPEDSVEILQRMFHNQSMHWHATHATTIDYDN